MLRLPLRRRIARLMGVGLLYPRKLSIAAMRVASALTADDTAEGRKVARRHELRQAHIERMCINPHYRAKLPPIE